MTEIDLNQFREGYRGKPFRELVEYHLRRMGQDERNNAVLGTVELLSPSAKPLAETFIDRWNVPAHDQNFWDTDTTSVFNEIIEDAREVLSEAGAPTDDDTLFNMFNVVVMNFACRAHAQPKVRELIGSRARRFPWVSALALLYPAAAALNVSMNTPAPTSMVLGYGIGNLGYLLIAAGIFAGTFKILGLYRRWHVFIAAALAVTLGIYLTNVGFQYQL